MLCAVAAAWKVSGCGPCVAAVGRLTGHTDPRGAMRGLARRGFMSIGGRGRYMDYRTAKPTARGWAEVAP